jgi:hypothetical protein
VTDRPGGAGDTITVTPPAGDLEDRTDAAIEYFG